MTRPRHVVVMVTTSYPRFPGDTVGTFIEPIAKGVAARGHQVHVVLPWHPDLRRGREEDGVRFHPFKYAPLRSLNVFGYAAALREDVRLRPAALIAAPLALGAGSGQALGVAQAVKAAIVHAHWMIPAGAMGLVAAGRARPLVVSLHGSDVYVAERHALARTAARRVLQRASWITACSDDLRQRALAIGGDAARSEVLPYGVDAVSFAPDPARRASTRAALGLADDRLMVFAAGRLVKKKGFEYLIDAVAQLAGRWPGLTLVLAGGGDLDRELRGRAVAAGVADRIRFTGTLTHSDVAAHLAAADVVVVPSVRDDQGNVDGLPNIVMETLASGTPLVATTAGGIPAVVRAGQTGELVPERDVERLAVAMDALLRDPARRAALGEAARADVIAHHGWDAYAARLEAIYDGLV